MHTHVPKWTALFAVLSFAAACSSAPDGGEAAQELRGINPPPLFPVPQQSFLPFDYWTNAYVPNAESQWTSDTPVVFGHVNADAKDDFVGFGQNGTWVGISGDRTLSNLIYAGDIFSGDTGWHADRHVRLVGDINNDGLDDLVGFGDAGVWTALSNGHGFGPIRYVLADFGYNQGWRVDRHVRLLADVDGDHRQDIVAFGDAGVWVAFADGTGGFGPATYMIANFGTQQGWTVARHLRTTADLNNDGRADIVAFGNDGVWTALSAGAGFQAPHYVLASFGANAGWDVNVHERVLADADADGYKDIVGIFNDGVHVARSNGDGGFSAESLVLADSALSGPGRVVTDLNGDHYADILTYTAPVWSRRLGGPFGFGGSVPVLRAEVYPGWWTTADLDGNGMSDVVFFSPDWVEVARSTNVAPPPPNPAPTNVQTGNVNNGSVTISWTDNSDVKGYQVQANNYMPYLQVGRVFSATWYGLTQATYYCFKVRSFNDLGTSAWSAPACLTTSGSGGGGGDGTVGTFSVFMNEDPPPPTGTPTYTGHWVPQGRTITKFRSAYNLDDTVLFLKPGHGASECVPNSSATIALPPNGTLLPTDVAKISWTLTDGSVDYHACLLETVYNPNVVPTIIFNLDWK
jgi:hypothetical protein